MSLIIIGKMGIVGIGIAAASWGGIALTRLLTPTAVEIYGFVATPSTDADANTTHPLKCKIDSGNPVTCQVESVKKLTDDSKNHVLLSVFKTSHESEPIIAPDEKLTSEKLYKITVAASEIDATTTIKSIEVFKGTDFKTSIGTINNLFQIKEGSPTTLETWKTNYFVGQASADTSDITGYKCFWTTGATTGKDCNIKPFVDKDAGTNQKEESKISDLAFKQTDTVSSSTKTPHYYLIQFAAPSDPKDLESFCVEGSEIIYLKDGSHDKVTFKKLSAVAVVGDQLLILKQQQTAF